MRFTCCKKYVVNSETNVSAYFPVSGKQLLIIHPLSDFATMETPFRLWVMKRQTWFHYCVPRCMRSTESQRTRLFSQTTTNHHYQQWINRIHNGCDRKCMAHFAPHILLTAHTNRLRTDERIVALFFQLFGTLMAAHSCAHIGYVRYTTLLVSMS